MNNIRVEDMDKTTTAEVLLKYFEQLDMDKMQRKELTSYEQGKIVGFLKCIDFIKSIANKG